MFIVSVHIRVKTEHRAAFLAASLDNARNTTREPGNLRFDVLQQLDDADRFVLYEVYRDELAMQAHKATEHYARWNDAVVEMMAEKRYSVKYAACFPTEASEFATYK